VDDNDVLGRSAADLQNILQYGLDHLFGDAAGKGAAASSATAAEEELTEEELEAIVTGSIDEIQKGGTNVAAATSDEQVAAASSSPAAAASAKDKPPAAAAAASARPSFSRIATHALPSLEAASLAPLDSVDEELGVGGVGDTIYSFEGQDYKPHARSPCNHSSRSASCPSFTSCHSIHLFSFSIFAEGEWTS
jgi:hypothetical protein